jgi:predicted ABC-type transport system involved in lysophospholipase L1 biosynthesis ATPase subunit
VVYVTHDMNFAERADRGIRIVDGEIEKQVF